MPTTSNSVAERLWQVAFLIGLAICVILGVILFNALFMTLLAGITALITILNALLSPARQSDPRSTWFVSTVKRALNVTLFLRLATILVWALVASLILYGGLAIYRTALRTTVDGYVMTAGGDPADGAVVAFSLKGQELTTVTDKGKFSIILDLAGAETKIVSLRVRWHGIETTKAVNLSAGSPRDLIVTLPPGPPPLRISYFLLGGYSVDSLLRGKIDKRWEEKLSGQPYIITNSVFKALSSLAEAFSGTFDHDEFLLDTKSSTDQIVGNLAAPPNDLGTSFFVGTWSPKYFTRPVSGRELQLALETTQGWNLYTDRQGKSSLRADELLLWKFAGKADIASFYDLPQGYSHTREWVKFYSYVTKEYLPPDFCYVKIPLGYCGDIVVEQLTSRVLQLRVAVVENVSSHPIRIGKFRTRENPTNSLRLRDVDQRTLGARTAQEEELFPHGVLGPGDKIVIPNEMSFVFEKNELPYLTKLVRSASDAREHDELSTLCKTSD